LRVPSIEVCSATTSGRASVNRASRAARSSFDTLVIAEKLSAPRT
jgi:hypothetical protein